MDVYLTNPGHWVLASGFVSQLLLLDQNSQAQIILTRQNKVNELSSHSKCV